jgi:hypothetical protein
MKLVAIGTNHHVVLLGSGARILVHGEMPVAFRDPVGNWFRTLKRNGMATNRHIRAFCQQFYDETDVLPQVELEEKVAGL